MGVLYHMLLTAPPRFHSKAYMWNTCVTILKLPSRGDVCQYITCMIAYIGRSVQRGKVFRSVITMRWSCVLRNDEVWHGCVSRNLQLRFPSLTRTTKDLRNLLVPLYFSQLQSASPVQYPPEQDVCLWSKFLNFAITRESAESRIQTPWSIDLVRSKCYQVETREVLAGADFDQRVPCSNHFVRHHGALLGDNPWIATPYFAYSGRFAKRGLSFYLRGWAEVGLHHQICRLKDAVRCGCTGTTLWGWWLHHSSGSHLCICPSLSDRLVCR